MHKKITHPALKSTKQSVPVKAAYLRYPNHNNRQLITLFVITAFSIFIFACMPWLSQKGIPVIKAFSVFMGIFLQAIPFLLLGVLLSSAIQIFLPDGFIEKIFSKNIVLSMLFGIFGGLFLPVCDCVSIPVFRSLIKKGVPLPAAVCFMTCSPIINPVVLLSTYYAFGNSITAVLYRTGTGILCSLLISLTFLIRQPHSFFKENTETLSFCNCGCNLEDTTLFSLDEKIFAFFQHAKNEFYNVAKYLLIGISISTIFQMTNMDTLKSWGNENILKAVFAAILLSFLLSLCSSSDAVIAQSLSGTFCSGALLGFLVFGPMMDIKNILMLHGYFKKEFIIRLVLTTFFVCYCVVIFADLLHGGTIL